MVLDRSRSLQMAHDCARHAFEKGQLVWRQPIPRLLVQDAVCADAMTARAPNGHSSIETRVRRASHEWEVAEALVLAKVVHDKIWKVARVVNRQSREFWSKINSVIAKALLFRENGGAKAQAVVLELRTPARQRQSPRGFGEEETVSPVEEGYETSTRVQTQSPQLRKCCQGLVVRCLRGII